MPVYLSANIFKIYSPLTVGFSTNHFSDSSQAFARYSAMPCVCVCVHEGVCVSVYEGVCACVYMCVSVHSKLPTLYGCEGAGSYFG